MSHAWQNGEPFGGHRFLDFLNAINDPEKTRDDSGLPDIDTLLLWARQFGILEEQREIPQPTDADQALFASLIGFREQAWQCFHLRAEAGGGKSGEQGGADLFDPLQPRIREALSRARLVPGSDGLWHWIPAGEEGGRGEELLRRISDHLALDCLDLLTSHNLARLKECGRCTGLYLDHGRGRGRRWCRMSICGNREKIARYRSKDGEQPEGA